MKNQATFQMKADKLNKFLKRYKFEVYVFTDEKLVIIPTFNEFMNVTLQPIIQSKEFYVYEFHSVSDNINANIECMKNLKKLNTRECRNKMYEIFFGNE